MTATTQQATGMATPMLRGTCGTAMARRFAHVAGLSTLVGHAASAANSARAIDKDGGYWPLSPREGSTG